MHLTPADLVDRERLTVPLEVLLPLPAHPTSRSLLTDSS